MPASATAPWPARIDVEPSARTRRARGTRARTGHARRRPFASAYLAAAAICLPLPAAAGEPSLTRKERAALAAGELVKRPLRVHSGELELIGGASWQRIDASCPVVWRALHDVSRYPKWLPGAVEARVIDTRDSTTEVYVEHAVWPFRADYTAIVDSDPAALLLSFRLNTDRPHDPRAGWGFAKLTPSGGQCVLAFGILADVGEGMLGAIAQSVIQPWMLRVPRQLKIFLDSGGRKLYAR